MTASACDAGDGPWAEASEGRKDTPIEVLAASAGAIAPVQAATLNNWERVARDILSNSNPVTVLGYDPKNLREIIGLTEASVSKKCRSLLSRYHPDKYR